MAYNPEVHRRQSIRLRGYDYSRAGAYFVTLCAWQRECLFGEVVDGEMWLNDAGRIIDEAWQRISTHFSGVDIDQCVIMPNHFHGIVSTVGAGSPRPDLSRNVNKIPETQGGETPPLIWLSVVKQIIAFPSTMASGCAVLQYPEPMPGQNPCCDV